MNCPRGDRLPARLGDHRPARVAPALPDLALDHGEGGHATVPMGCGGAGSSALSLASHQFGPGRCTMTSPPLALSHTGNFSPLHLSTTMSAGSSRTVMVPRHRLDRRPHHPFVTTTSKRPNRSGPRWPAITVA